MKDNEFVTPTADTFPANFEPAFREWLASELRSEDANGTAYCYHDGVTGRYGVYLPRLSLNVPIELYPVRHLLRSLEDMLTSLGGAA